jgi:hypothetical protein
MTEERLPLAELLAKAGDGDFLRSVAEAVVQLLRWPRDFGQGDKLFPLERETGRYGQSDTEAVRG